jgi:predicted nucleic acid-binding protein
MPKSLVVDASFAIRLILPDPRRGALCAQMERWLQEGYELLAPDLWLYEMITALCKGAFFGLITAEEAENSLPLVSELAIQLVAADAEQARLAFVWTRRLNRAAAYDSFYLALAESLNCELWTADRRLHNAVGLPWVRLAGAPS